MNSGLLRHDSQIWHSRDVFAFVTQATEPEQRPEVRQQKLIGGQSVFPKVWVVELVPTEQVFVV